jgi:NAD(P)-dependent dehydrogenase (short-subunit alcohol dehydrogenase family)
MVADVLDHYGQIDLLVTVAGVIEVSLLEDLVIDDFRHAMDVMFWGTLYPIMAALPSMRARKAGRIATITSIGGKISVPRLLSYSTAKFAAVGLSEGLAAELAKDGIHVTTIVPGIMRTGSHLNARFKGDTEQQNADYSWFSVGASLPINPRADRAARIIVRSIKRGETERIFSLPYGLASRLHGLAPATTIRLMQIANAVLPYATIGGPTSKNRGVVIKDRLNSRVLNVASALADEAVDDFNERPGPVHTVDA